MGMPQNPSPGGRPPATSTSNKRLWKNVPLYFTGMVFRNFWFTMPIHILYYQARGLDFVQMGTIEAVISVLAVVHDTIPPTANLTTPDPECDLDYVPLTARKSTVRVAMSNGFGFGGHNASIILRKADLD